MRTELFWILSICGFAAVSIACGLLAWPQLASVWPGIQEQIDRFHRLPPLAKVSLLVFIAGFIAYGSTKTNQVDQTSGTNGVEIVEGGGTNAPPLMLMMPMPFADDESPTVMPEDAARGYQLVEVRTNAAVDYTMPDGAILATNWWVRGAYEDVKQLDFNGWRFPFGSNGYDSAWAFAWGKLRFELADTNEIVAVGALMSAVPYRSRLWSAADTNGSRFVTWESFFLNRDTNTPVNAQVELFEDGDFVTRSNGVEKVFHRIDPDDWDGDGWRNGDDPDPYTWDDPWDDFYQELPDGANEDAYCWIEIRPRWHSYIEFVGDGPSDLDDPYLWAKAGETYRVQLLIGKTYFIESTQPLDVVGQSDSSIEVDGDGTSEINVVWPVQFSAMSGNGSGFRMRVIPACLGGTFVWTDSCCPITGSGVEFWYAHCGSCGCGGCYASGEYRYQGYCLSCTGGWCDCPYNEDDDPYGSEEDDGPYASGASVSFSDSVVIFEDAYTNMPGEVVARQSTRTTLTCVAHGGDTGGTATFTIEGDAKLVSCAGGSLPVTRFVPPCQKIEFEIDYEGKLPSGGERDIVAKADFTERGTGTRHSTQRDWLTSVKVELEAVYEAPANPNPNRHVYGVGEKIKLSHRPIAISLYWELIPRDHNSILLNEGGCDRVMKLYHLAGLPVGVKAVADAVEYQPAFSVLEPQSVVCQSASWDGDCLPKGQAGGFGMDLALYIAPMTVSFQGIDVAEIPCNEYRPPEGYYATTNFDGVLSHSLAAGAGVWHHVSAGNYWCNDNAKSNRRKQVWSNGRMVWDVPIQWYERFEGGTSWPLGLAFSGAKLIGGSPETYQQVFEISEEGLVSITKHSHCIDRNTNDVIRLDGVMVHDGSHR